MRTAHIHEILHMVALYDAVDPHFWTPFLEQIENDGEHMLSIERVGENAFKIRIDETNFVKVSCFEGELWFENVSVRRKFANWPAVEIVFNVTMARLAMDDDPWTAFDHFRISDRPSMAKLIREAKLTPMPAVQAPRHKTPIPGILLNGKQVFADDYPEPPEGAMSAADIERRERDTKFRFNLGKQ